MAQIAVPTLILHGTADTLISLRHGERLAAAAPNATLVRVRGAGHELAYLPVSQAKIADWLSRLQPIS